MGGTWWQWMWRWIVALEVIVCVVGTLEVNATLAALRAMGLPHLSNFQYELALSAGGLAWFTATVTAKALLLVSLPMLVLVELVAWWNRLRRRRLEASDRRAIQRAAKQWDPDDL